MHCQSISFIHWYNLISLKQKLGNFLYGCLGRGFAVVIKEDSVMQKLRFYEHRCKFCIILQRNCLCGN